MSPPSPPAPTKNMEYNSEAPLPYPWKEYSDLRTGEIYYINWRNGIRTSVDPRISEEEAEAAGYYPSDDDDDDDNDDDEDDDDDDDEDFDESVDYAEDDNSFDSFDTTSEDEVAIPHVSGRCRTCGIYYLAAQNIRECPRCGSPLIHLPHNRRSV